MDPNDLLSSALGLVHHHLIVSMLGGNIGRLERDRDRDGIYTIPYYPTPSLANLPLQKMLSGTRFTAPLHGILTQYGLLYATSTYTSTTLASMPTS